MHMILPEQPSESVLLDPLKGSAMEDSSGETAAHGEILAQDAHATARNVHVAGLAWTGVHAGGIRPTRTEACSRQGLRQRLGMRPWLREKRSHLQGHKSPGECTTDRFRKRLDVQFGIPSSK